MQKKTKVGAFLKKAAPALLKVLGTTVKTFTGLDISKVTDAIMGSTELTEVDKETALALLELDKADLLAISERWKNDATSDSWLSKNVRPIVLMFLVGTTSLFCFLDSVATGFTVKEHWVTLFSTILVVVVGAYFGGRSWEKAKKIVTK
tara:strand:- start:330 stop:776 length:447 start_codon:yes stop_codon:yes gene_type:complete